MIYCVEPGLAGTSWDIIEVLSVVIATLLLSFDIDIFTIYIPATVTPRAAGPLSHLLSKQFSLAK